MTTTSKTSRDPARIARDLRRLVRGDVLDDDLNRALYSTDASIYQILPTCVLLPKCTEDVVATVHYAAENRIPVVGRGGGTGLAGESLCSGIVIDFSRYLDTILDVDESAGVARCQAGVIFERLNTRVAASGWLFGPDPASGISATIGGMVGNNSTGSHSLKYDYVDRWIEKLEVVLADGQLATLTPQPVDAHVDGPAAPLAQSVRTLVDANRHLIDTCMPQSKRNRSGYALDKVVSNGQLHLGRLVAGSEGTLAIVTEATLKLVPIPKVKALLGANFQTLEAMAEAVPRIAACDPATCELMDGGLIELARGAFPQYKKVLPAGAAASLLIEVDGDTDDEVRAKLDNIRNVIDGAALHEYIDPSEQKTVWQARSAGLPLLFRKPGPRQPVPFIEDAAVPVEAMPEYLAAITEILNRHQVPFALYAHAGHGELHTRPYLNLHDPADVATMRRVAEELFERVWQLGGTISGEHGEGLVRVPFVRRQYGKLYPAMEQVKRLFDPHNILNPGKIINDDPEVMTRDLRFGHSARPLRTSQVLLHWSDGEFVHEIEQCNGNGACRSLQNIQSMCPIFRAKRDEFASPRAHANMMRHFVTGLLDSRSLTDPRFKALADTCVNCKMCHLECPSGVNIPKLMLEARAQYVAEHGLDRTCWFLARSELVSKLGCWTAPIANFTLSRKFVRRILEWVVGIDRRRTMPRFEFGTFLSKAATQPGDNGHAPANKAVDRVVYFVDMYANYNDHSLARAVIAVLQHNGVEVVVPPDQQGCAMPPIDYGDLAYATPTIHHNARLLADWVRRGYKIVASEPTAVLCLKEEYLDVAPSADAQLVAENTYELHDYLMGLLRADKLRTDFGPVPMHVGYHAPCHLKALQNGLPGFELLQRIPELKVSYIDRGCCGVAGTYGFQKRHFDTSMAAGRDLLDALTDDRFEAGASECGTCKMQMEQGSGKVTHHPAKLLARAYGLKF